MILGLFSLSAYTIMHVIISLVGIAAGFVVMAGVLGGKRRDRWTFWFLLTTVLTNLTGFGFPFERLLPSHIVGIISLVALLIAIVARYAFGMAGPWRWLYIVAAILAQWFNVFVLIVQSFQKAPFLQALAPTQSEPPFLVVQTVVMILFIITGIAALRKFHPMTA